jgi:hypothetical protein
MPAKLTLSADTKEALRTFAAGQGLTQCAAVEFLLEFYQLQHLDRLVGLVARQANEGFDHVQLAQLSALYTLLGHLKERTGFH